MRCPSLTATSYAHATDRHMLKGAPCLTQVMDEAEETVALVLNDDGALIGVLTKASVVEAITASRAADVVSLSK